MTTSEPPQATKVDFQDEWNRSGSAWSEPIGNLTGRFFGSLASLRLTVVLFALLIFLVFVGTLAQVDHGIWYVVDHAYFRVWIAEIEFQTLERLVQMLTPVEWNLAGSFPFPGGYLIGAVMAVNLLVAHQLRFKLVAKGNRLAAGVGVIGVGLALTYAIILSGMDNALESELSTTFCYWLWQSLKLGSAALVLAGAYGLLLSYGRIRWVEWTLMLVLNLLVTAMVLWLFLNPSVRLDDSGLRILWQLLKGVLAGSVLLSGCAIVFARRAGIVLLHGGILLLMFSEFWTGVTAKESNMTIFEGQTANYSYDTRATELAIVDHMASETEDHVTVIPAAILASARPGEIISDEQLPFDIEVIRFLENSRLAETKPGGDNLANVGAGKHVVAKSVKTAAGVSTDDMVDMPSVYLRLISKKSGEALGTYLFSTAGFQTVGDDGSPREVYLSDEKMDVDGRPYDVGLRFERDYKPYSVTLLDFQHNRYVGTNKPKDFTSLIRLRDPVQKIDREFRIWMNNPLRYSGETLYQASFDEKTEQATVLQVVSNPGWMMPYVACMLVGIGMLAHFGLTLQRFMRRRYEVAVRLTKANSSVSGGVSATVAANGSSRKGWLRCNWFPLVVLVLCGAYVGGKARVVKDPVGELKFSQFAKFPVAYQGRIQPFDTVARNSLQILSGRQTVIVPEDAPSGGLSESPSGPRQLPAIEWFLDVISARPGGDQHRVFRIDNLELLDALGLERRPGSFRYSFAELRPSIEPEQDEEGRVIGDSVIDKQARLARSVPPAERTLFQQKVDELYQKLSRYFLIKQVFSSPEIRADREHILADMQRAQAQIQELFEGMHDKRREWKLILAVPPATASKAWTFLLDAEFNLLRNRVLGKEVNPATVAMSTLLSAYARNDSVTFNRELGKYRTILASYQKELVQQQDQLRAEGMAESEMMNQGKIDFEVFFNRFSPFYYAAVLYLLAFLLASLSWLGWSQPLNRAASWVLMLAFLLHTFALLARIYISGRPPVTNLYSSAIFIGWACVLFGLILEALYRWGIGNIVASVIGFLTLIIAYNLSLDGDTFIVLQAVLDTQFWLATHVVCITLGYSTTFLAGFLGALYIVMGSVLGILDRAKRQQLSRMIYGSLCFALFFSFIGTVLGGLWADDSWGRFWGWDPKENGALIIVLWNALVLHARWGGLVGSRGLAALVVAGNIVTSWSWFGVNELGVGLHSYGFREGTTLWLFLFAISQLLLIAIAMTIAPRDRTPGDRLQRKSKGSQGRSAAV
ncbi:MAG: cytochrome c biogenesis protein CcsA [Pirellulales bacterium]|nr:cytochrome c biogenesis protein CcsA [Pirellulales bacterium]